MMIAAPLVASSRAVWSPMPVLPPVMTTALPSTLPSPTTISAFLMTNFKRQKMTQKAVATSHTKIAIFEMSKYFISLRRQRQSRRRRRRRRRLVCFSLRWGNIIGFIILFRRSDIAAGERFSGFVKCCSTNKWQQTPRQFILVTQANAHLKYDCTSDILYHLFGINCFGYVETITYFILRNGPTPASFSFFSVFPNKHQYNFYNKYVKKCQFHPVYGARIRTHDLSIMSHHLPLPLDQGSRQ